MKITSVIKGSTPPALPAQGVGLAVFATFALTYVLAYGLRSVNATLAPYLTEDLRLSAAGLGGLSAAYFIAFAALQLPLGHWLDRYGARRVEAMLLVIAAVGALLMALGRDITVATAGRLCIGIGVSACLMAPYTYFRRCCTPERQARLSQWMLVAGTTGAVLATLPTGAMAEWLGWRGVFGTIAVLLLGSAVAVYRLVPDHDLAAMTRRPRRHRPLARPVSGVTRTSCPCCRSAS
ncbi:MFS transporter [Achromobacter sp. GG226]|uniref:MFS transporter n=1 Tax=Verticiella alkaliphila TaxID=2779529 RepID=UPI001C0C19CA|nr:MFS transporter [Verticiella sp. GG226]